MESVSYTHLEVSLDDDTIYYTIKNGEKTQVYKTGRINDQQEVERLDLSLIHIYKDVIKNILSRGIWIFLDIPGTFLFLEKGEM